MIEYSANGNHGYSCVLESPRGYVLTVEASRDLAEPLVTGDDSLTSNASLKAQLLAYAINEFQYRRLRATEKRASHRKQADEHGENAEALAGWIDALGRSERSGWCSACFTHTTHRHVSGMNRPVKTYLCDNCGGPTSACAAPRCSHMASRGFKRLTSPRYCAPHRHEIPSFEKLEEQLEEIDDYESWLEFEYRNLSRVTKIAALTVVAGAALAPAALVAAPAIGGATGALAGLSGAAATSHGLALWGGGSLAAGGLGMAGGTTVITALGGGLGSALGAAVTSAYVRTDSSFKIENLRDGHGPAVLFATGFLTEPQTGWGEWRRLIESRYPDAPVYRVHWGSKELKAFAILAGSGATQHVIRRSIRGLVGRASKKAVAAIGPLGTLVAASDLLKNPWSLASNRAEMTGAALADILARTTHGEFILMGHSLGGRVMVTTAEVLASKSKDRPRIESMHLFGAAVSRGADWHALNSAVSERVWNYYSRNDAVLRYAYQTGELGKQAVGRVGFNSKFAKVTDRNVSRQVTKHGDYVKKVKLARPSAR